MNTIASGPAPATKAPVRGADPAADSPAAPSDGFAALLDQSMTTPAEPSAERAPSNAGDDRAIAEPEQSKPRADAHKTPPAKTLRRNDNTVDLAPTASSTASAAMAKARNDGAGDALAIESEDKPDRPADAKTDTLPADIVAPSPAALTAPTLPAAAAIATHTMAAKLSADDQGAGPGAAEVDARRAIKSPAIDAKPLVHEQAAARETPSGFGPKAVASTDAAANAMPIAALPAAPIAPRANEVPTQAHVAATVDTPAFAPALATQVRWLVEGGVQHAQLSLNPAEMGPVAVHIAVDGAQARIDFSAEIAGTRSAIESSLPTLAAALTASGLTLAGGGVYDGTPRRPSGQPGSPGRGPVQGEARVDGAPLEAAMTALRSGAPARGLVDLMA